jgi:hypothetical protein
MALGAGVNCHKVANLDQYGGKANWKYHLTRRLFALILFHV